MHKLLLPILVLACLAGAHPALSCTVTFYADDETALAGNNEDFFFPYTQADFLPAEEGKYGRVYFGYQARSGVSFGPQQGGMNERGLFFDGLATDPLPVEGTDDKENCPGNLLERMLEECATVEEALALFGGCDLSFMASFQTMIADRTGDAAIIEGDAVIRKSGPHLVATNFYQSRGGYCPRYDTAMRMLGAGGGTTVESMRDILDAVHQEGGVHTVYSNVYDLERGLIHVYHFHDFARPVTFDLAAELAKGEHTVDLASVFPEKRGFAAFEAKQRAQLDEQKRDQEDAFARYLSDIRAPGKKPDEGPSGEEVMQHYLEAIGGREAFASIRSRVTHSELVLAVPTGLSSERTRMEGTATTWRAHPGRFRERVELDGGIVIERGTDGGACWQSHSHRPGRLLAGDEVEAMRLEATLDPHPAQLYASVENLGQVSVRGEATYKILLTPRSGPPQAAFFSKETGLLVSAVSASRNESEGPRTTEVVYRDYGAVDGVLLPRRATFETKALTALGPRRVTVSADLSYEHNLEIPDDRFAVPDTVAAGP